MGEHYICDLSGCDPALLFDSQRARALLIDSVKPPDCIARHSSIARVIAVGSRDDDSVHNVGPIVQRRGMEKNGVRPSKKQIRVDIRRKHTHLVRDKTEWVPQ